MLEINQRIKHEINNILKWFYILKWVSGELKFNKNNIHLDVLYQQIHVWLNTIKTTKYVMWSSKICRKSEILILR